MSSREGVAEDTLQISPPDDFEELLHFKMARSEQASSPLLCLPSELRTKILRFCLKHARPLQSLSEYAATQGLSTWEPAQNAAEYQSRMSYVTEQYHDEYLLFSPQLLRCCQKLYAESREILYGENTLSLWIEDLGAEVFEECVDLFDAHDTYGLRFSNSKLLAEGIGELGTSPNIDESSVGTGGPQHFVRRFQKLLINMSYINDRCFFSECRNLSRHVRGKNVALKFRNINSHQPIHIPIECCLAWRCKSFKIIDYHCENFHETASLITSDMPVKDLYGLCITFKEEVYKGNKDLKQNLAMHQFRNLYSDELNDL